jgi:molecular chaperone DnaK (HSP70)
MASSPGSGVIGAIDFGTSHTGLAYCDRKNPSRVFAKDDWEGAPSRVESKVPSSILFNEKKEVKAYGYDAESKFQNMDDSEMKKHYFFKGFKMLLHRLETFSNNVQMHAVDGKTLQAKYVFAKALNYLARKLCEFVETTTMGKAPAMHDVTWVITVPAIWDASARQFMKEAAFQGGLYSGKGKPAQIALEPECAALYLKDILAQKNNSLASNYAVVDCGGGTVDIAYHSCLAGKGQFYIEELAAPTGGPYGGTLADTAFQSFMDSIFKNGFMNMLKEKHPDIWLRLMESFELRKSMITPEDQPQYFPVSKELEDACLKYTKMTIETAIARSKVKGVACVKSKIRIESNVLRALFEKPVDWICDHIENQLRKRELARVDTLYVVGGFSQCKLLQNQLKVVIAKEKRLVDESRIVYPTGSQIAIVKGAVLHGIDPNIVQLRRARFTYGTNITPIFDPLIHRKDKRRVYSDGNVRCEDVFSTFITKGEIVKSSDPPREFPFLPVYADATSMGIPIFRSPLQKVEYCTDEFYCKKVGDMSLSMPDTTGGTSRKVIVQVKFFGTEVHTVATDVRNKKSIECRVDFLSDAV